jgi:hypothetical protein
MAATFDRSPADLRRFTKSKAVARIDMAVALAMAVGAATARMPKGDTSYLEQDDMLVL